MIWLFLLFQFAYADDAPVVQVLDPMPIIAVDDGRKLPENSMVTESAVDTELSSPLAPQTFDGFNGVVQEPFAPTDREREENRLKQEQEVKRLAAARAAQEQKAIASTLPKKSAPVAALPKKTFAPSKLTKTAQAGKPIAKRVPATAKKAGPGKKLVKPGALKVAPKPNKK